ncbi:hypothetical protein ACSN7O_004736 [Enterobacter chuandaensis]
MDRFFYSPATKKYSLLAVSISAALMASSMAMAACDIHTPSSNQSVTCDGADNTVIINAAGSVNVGVAVNAGADLTVAGRPAISLGDGSTVNNAGAITGDSA